MRELNTRTILMIHGAFVTAAMWDNWKGYFEHHGYKVIAPPWPHKNLPAPALRQQHPDPLVASIRLRDLVHYYGDIASVQAETPIIMGHSLGGLITQLLLQKNIGAAGIAIHSAPPLGVYSLKYSVLKSSFRPLGFYASANEPYLLSFKEWQYAVTNGMPHQQQLATYEQYAVPESRRILRDGLTAAARVDFGKPHAPLLLMGGSHDHVVPASLVYANFKRYKQNGYLTHFRELPGRNHFVLGQPTWEEDAAYVLDWIRTY